MDTPPQTDTETCMSATLEKCGISNFERNILKSGYIKTNSCGNRKGVNPKVGIILYCK